VLGTDILGLITLSSRLPRNGTVTVSPLSMTFSVQTADGNPVTFTDSQGSPYLDVLTLTTTTHRGVISAFSFDTSSSKVTSGSVQASTATNEADFSWGGPATSIFASADAGSLTKEHLGLGAPEIDPASAGAALTLLAGLLAMVCGRRHPPAA
jgi:hypothetical protein